MPSGTVTVVAPDEVAPTASAPTEREPTGNRKPFRLGESERYNCVTDAPAGACPKFAVVSVIGKVVPEEMVAGGALTAVAERFGSCTVTGK